MSRNKNHKFPRWQEFREAVDAALRRSPLEEGRYVFYTEAYDDIVSKFIDLPLDAHEKRRPLNGEIVSELGALAKEITLSSILAHTPQEPYFSTAHILRDALRQRGLVPSVSASDERWIDAIQIALAYNERKDPRLGATFWSQPSDITFARAINFFSTKGIDIHLTGDRVDVQSSSVWAALAATVTSPLAALGDTAAMQYVDALLLARFDPVVRRIHLHPTPDLMGRKVGRSLPCGHLYRAAIRTLGHDRVRGLCSTTPATVGEAATHLAALYEVEPFSTYETMFPPYLERIFEVLVRVALYDELFTIPQCEPTQMGRLMRDLFSDVASSGPVRMQGWTLDDAITLWQTLLSLTSHGVASTFVKRSQLRLLLTQKVGRSACDALLDGFVLSNPNRNYRLPSDAIHADTRECALAEASADRYWIAPQPFIGPAFFARLVSLYAKADKSISGRIGTAFEGQMMRRMNQLGIRCRRADVAGSKRAKAGDIDLILETDEIVALFELKKKGLTRKTNAGNDAQLVIDLARGLVHGVNQLTKHELTLLRTGGLKFTDGTKLSLDGRRIVKCVVSLTDYGGFHDGAIVRNMLNSFCRVSLRPNETLPDAMKAGLDEANEELKTLQSRHAEFMSLRPTDSNLELFDNLLFHNIFFVEHLLLTAPTADLLLKALLVGNRVVMGSRDPFFEHAFLHGG